ncbi:MAG: hypothetical protein U5L76_01225 [Patescibacteria group bacterium]|nr:hypothetical protein [Patescibacteria group bacterium]
MNNIEKKIPLENKAETMRIPEINIREEKGATLLSILLRGYNQDFGSHDHELSQRVDEYFEQNPLDEKSIKLLKEIKALEDDGVDGETLFNIVLTHDDEDRVESLLEFISKHKECVKKPEKLRNNLLKAINDLENKLPEALKQDFDKATSEDIKIREQNIEDSKQRIKKLIDFFRPQTNTTKTKEVVLLPTDFLMSEKSGVAFNFGDNLYISSHVDNPHNLEHEFLHCIINPIVDKLDKKLSDEQKQKISNLASDKLKVEQGYGKEYYSLLCEEFIRTYNDVFQHGKQPIVYNDFVQKIESLDEEQFNSLLSKKESLKNRCAQLQINTFEDFKNKSQEYFDAFEKNDLREIIFKFYQDFTKEKEKNPNLDFEEFVLKEFNNRI